MARKVSDVNIPEEILENTLGKQKEVEDTYLPEILHRENELHDEEIGKIYLFIHFFAVLCIEV